MENEAAIGEANGGVSGVGHQKNRPIFSDLAPGQLRQARAEMFGGREDTATRPEVARRVITVISRAEREFHCERPRQRE